jgi:hypothetical protein
MSTIYLQTLSESVKKIEPNYIIWVLSVPSIILFIMTIDSLTITEFPPDGFYYFSSLPFYYWIGIGLSTASLVISFLYDKRPTNDARLVPILLIGMFLYGTPVLTYEVPRFADIFAHGAEVLPIISNGHINSSDTYAIEYPSTFLLLAMFSIVQNADVLTLMRFTEIFTILTVVTLVYCISRVSNSRYAGLAPLGFMGAFWVDQGHFSPQGLSLVFYLIFFLAIIKALASNSSRRGWLVLAIIMLLAVNFTSPTNSLFLILNLGTIAAISYLLVRKNVVTNRILIFTAIAGTIFLCWSIYNAESKTILKAQEFEQRIVEDFGSLETIKVTPAPSESYQTINDLRLMVVGFVILSGIAISVAVTRKKSAISLILVGWFATASFIVITMYLSPVLLSRTFLYISIPWALLIASLFVQKDQLKWHKSLKAMLVVIVLLLVLSIPITRYGRDPNTYAPLALLNSAEMLADHSNGGESVVSYFMGSLVTKYFAAANGVNMETAVFEPTFQKSFTEGNMSSTYDRIHSETTVNGRVIFSDAEKNNIAMKFDEPQLYDEIEDKVKAGYNLIINNGSTRIYSSTSTISTQ